MKYYILSEDKTVIEVPRECWEEFSQHTEFRRVGYDTVNRGVETFYVSTVFLTFIMSPMHPFETMIFSKDSSVDLFCERHSTWDDAEEAHKDIVKKVESGELKLSVRDF